MNDLKIKGTFNEAAGKLKQKYADLTNDDKLFRKGKEEEVLGKVQKNLGKAQEVIHDSIKKW